MVKTMAWTVVVVGSLAATFACSSKTSGGNTGFDGENEGGGGQNNENNGDGGSSTNGTMDATTATSSCANPFQEISLFTGKSLPAGCDTCVSSSCSSDLTACQTSSCLACGPTLYACAQASCSSECFPVSEGGASSGSSGGSSSGGASGSDGGSNSCTQIQSCCAFSVECGCTAVGFLSADAGAGCSAAVSSNNTAECAAYYSAIKSAGSAFGVTCSM